MLGSSLRALLYDLGESLVLGKSPLSEGGDLVEDEVLKVDANALIREIGKLGKLSKSEVEMMIVDNELDLEMVVEVSFYLKSFVKPKDKPRKNLLI
nr:hypothetical protein [Tanacetum cinerariifolium]